MIKVKKVIKVVNVISCVFFIYLFLACWVFVDVHRLSLYSLVGVHRLLIAMAPPVVKHMCFTQFFKNCEKRKYKIQLYWMG